MRKRKIRGHNRLHKRIEKWRLDNISLELSNYLLKVQTTYYTKIRVHPYSGISLINSTIPQPKGKTKKLILSALLDICEDWKNQLEKIGKPYYLKVWLFEPRFSTSEVVCAIDEDIDFYENTFFNPYESKSITFNAYGQLKAELEKYTWDYRLDEDTYTNAEVGNPEMYVSLEDYNEAQKWFAKLLKKPHRIYKLNAPFGDIFETYSFKRGYVLLGEKKL